MELPKTTTESRSAAWLISSDEKERSFPINYWKRHAQIPTPS